MAYFIGQLVGALIIGAVLSPVMVRMFARFMHAPASFIAGYGFTALMFMALYAFGSADEGPVDWTAGWIYPFTQGALLAVALNREARSKMVVAAHPKSATTGQNNWERLGRVVKVLAWPSVTASNPSLISRMGRVIHWSLSVLALMIILFALLIDQGSPAIGAVIALVFLMLGRAVRYVLSAE